MSTATPAPSTAPPPRRRTTPSFFVEVHLRVGTVTSSIEVECLGTYSRGHPGSFDEPPSEAGFTVDAILHDGRDIRPLLGATIVEAIEREVNDQ
jgi:hypothetical protein